MFTKVLVANRGEIARRVFATCRRLGIATVAVYSDADQDAPHVADADEAVRLGPPPAAESYLDSELVLAAAIATGADAIHPGYGFLSENADFARACAEAGITFIGPNVEAIAVMGDKGESKRLLEPAGVPMVPGVHSPGLTDDDLIAAAATVGFPALVKAVAGGGGKGMRTVASLEDLPEAIGAARREAAKAFGDDTLIMERYITRSRHVEVQVFGDAHGNVIHLFERECSVQRRHQKVVEETPSTAVDADLRARMGAAAVKAAQAVNYQGAGTVEFLLTDTGEFFFLEMNTRLQVEHPVTEAITGLDLVEMQLRVAAGEPLGLTQDQITSSGHAIEVRVYAEDPAAGFLPQLGTVARFEVPLDDDVRVDTGVEDGSEVSRFYDPMLAKIIVHGPDRATSLARMSEVLAGTAVLGVATNVDHLRAIVEHPAFLAGDVTTSFLDDHLPDFTRPDLPAEVLLAAAAAVAPPTDDDVWGSLGPWRIAGVGGWPLRFADGED
ncbi:MAG: acetyl-CoA/propionyl-CoA carboxylase biotin carboxyl carrier protein, partial [Glaciecola sp.]